MCMQDGHDNTMICEQDWRHSIAVINGRIHCMGLKSGGILAQNLHLDEDGKPHRGNANEEPAGYMKRILRVYEVVRRSRH